MCVYTHTYIQVTLEQYDFELRRSTYTWIFSNKYSTCIFTLQTFEVCLIRDHSMWNQKNQGLSPDAMQTVSVSALGWIIYQSLHFWGRDTNNSDFYLTGGLAPVIPHTVQGLAVCISQFLYPFFYQWTLISAPWLEWIMLLLTWEYRYIFKIMISFPGIYTQWWDYWIIQFSLVQSLSRVQLFVTPWTAAHQASLSITNSRSLLKLMFIMSVMPYNHLILCRPLLLLPSIFPSNRVISNQSVLHIRWPKYWSFSFSISSSNEYSELISFRMDWLDSL